MNKITKRLLVSAIAVGAICSLAACGKKDTPQETDPSIQGPHLVEDVTEAIPTETELVIIPTGEVDNTNTDETTADSADATTNTDDVADRDDPNHIHNYQTASTVEATCATSGKVVKQCACGSSKTESIPAIGHNYKETSSTAATCTTAGSTVKICSNCQDKKTENVAALGHNYKVTSTTKATCSASGTEVKICQRCNDKQTTNLPKLTHSYTTTTTDATCTTDGKSVEKCNNCGAAGTTKTIAALGHDFKDTVTKEATCSEEGLKDRVCSRCKFETTEKIAKSEHKYETITVAATCTTKGSETVKCSVCQNVKTVTTLPVAGHKYVEKIVKQATCKEAGLKQNVCSVCKDTKEETIPKSGTHNYETVVTVEPTCETAGTQVDKCKVCGVTINTKNIAKLGHDWVDSNKVEPTCTTDGSVTRQCDRCKKTQDAVVLNKLNHDYKETEKVAATCSAAGYVKTKCSRCQDEQKTTLEKTAHTEDIEVTVKPTCSEYGMSHVTCSVCKADLGDREIREFGPCDESKYVFGTSENYSYDECPLCYRKINCQYLTSQLDAAVYMLNLVNNFRAENGLEALKLSPKANTMAQYRAEEIYTDFSHNSAGGYNDGYGENCASGYINLDVMFKEWCNSPGHRDNILNADYGTFGFAYYTYPTKLGLCGVQLFYF